MKFSLENLQSLKQVLRELSAGLDKLSFSDNFEGFEQEIELTSGSEAKIRNQLKFIPNAYIILMQEGNGLLTKSGAWTKDHVFITNNGPSTVTATIKFLRK